MRRIQAQGCAVFEIDNADELVRRFWCGVSVPNPEWDGQEWKAIGALTIPLSIDGDFAGLIVYAWPSRFSVSPEKCQLLERTTRIIELLLGLFRAVDEQTRLAARIGELEADLADEKIADRVTGLMDVSDQNGEAIETIERHVGKVLGSRSFGQILDNARRELEDRVAERSLTAQAKAVLQAEHGMSEQQAYLHLRVTSRQSRQRIGDVAQNILKRRDNVKKEEDVELPSKRQDFHGSMHGPQSV